MPRKGAGGPPAPYGDSSTRARDREVRATLYDPAKLGARCDRCWLRGKSPPVPPEINRGARMAAVGEAPGENEIVQLAPFVGASGMEMAYSLQPVGMRRQDFSWFNALACRPPNNDLKLLRSRVSKANKARSKKAKAHKVDRDWTGCVGLTGRPNAGVPKDGCGYTGGKPGDECPQCAGVIAAPFRKLPSPEACCRPRLLHELDGYTDVIALGGSAVSALVPNLRKRTEERVEAEGNSAPGILSIRGGPIHMRVPPTASWGHTGDLPETWRDGHGRGPKSLRVLPTVHPAFVLRSPKWRPAFRTDLGRAWRFFNGKLNWTDPEVVRNPTPAELAAWLGVERTPAGWVARRIAPLIWDYETEKGEPLDVRVRCLGMGNTQRALVPHFLSVDGHTRFYSERDERTIEDIIRCWMLGPSLKIGWNSGGFDSLVSLQHLGVVPAPQLDAMLVHRLIAAEEPHNLGYVGSLKCDVTSWKAGKTATSDDTDDETLGVYCGVDDAVTAHVTTPLVKEMRQRKLGDLVTDEAGTVTLSGLLKVDHEIQRVGRTMHINGMLLDQDARQDHEDDYSEQVAEHAEVLWDIVGDLDRQIAAKAWFNPRSTRQVARLLYEVWGLSPLAYTKSGNPSVSAAVLERHIAAAPTEPGYLTEDQATVVALIAVGRDRPIWGTVEDEDGEMPSIDEAGTRLMDLLREHRPALDDGRTNGFNPASGPQVAALLYDVWKMVPVKYTDTGLESVDDEALRMHLRQSDLPDVARTFILALRKFRKVDKLLNTYIRPAAPPVGMVPRKGGPMDVGWDVWREQQEALPVEQRDWNVHPSGGVVLGTVPNWDDPNVRKTYKKGWLRVLRTGEVLGEVHFSWKTHVPVTGRMSSSPNAQNIPIKLRDMFVAHPGHVFVAADSDQLEMRIAAGYWGMTKYLTAFADGLDAHQITMYSIFKDEMWRWKGCPPPGRRFWKKWEAGPWGPNGSMVPAGKIGGKFDEMRDLAKRVCYASLYGAGAETVHSVITEAEDDAGKLIYQDLPLREVAAMREAWLADNPEVRRGWATELAKYRAHGFTWEPVTGRIRLYADGEEVTEINNFFDQASGAAIMNTATIEVDAKYPLHFAGLHTGLVNQCHDELTIEVPAGLGKDAAKDLEAAMSGECPAFPGVKFGAGARSTIRWKPKKKRKKKPEAVLA